MPRRFRAILAAAAFLSACGTVSILRAATSLESYNAGTLAYQQGRFEEALVLYQASMTADPSSWQAPLAVGNCLYRLNRKQEAVPAYEKSLALHPDPVYQTFLERLKAELLQTIAAPTANAPAAAPQPGPQATSSLASKTRYPQSVIYLGLAALPYKGTGWKDAVASDWETFDDLSEGRARLPLSRAALSQIRPGFEIGGEFYFRPRISATLEGRMMFKDQVSRALAVLLGLDYHFYATEKFSLGIVPKVGYGRVDIDFGTASWVAGSRSPVTLPEGFVYEGDDVSGRWQGVLAEAAVQGWWRFHPKVGLYARAGYLKSFFGTPMITAGSATLSCESPALVLDDGSHLSAGLDPQGGLDGFTAHIGVALFN